MLVIENVHLHEFMAKNNIKGVTYNLYNYLRDRSTIMFEEISSGVYQVVKDRTGVQFKYVDSRLVANALHHKSRVVIKRLDGKFVTNEDSLEDF